MRALVVYESMFGNTRRIAEAIVRGLDPLIEVSLAGVDEAPSPLPAAIDLVVAGGPTHAFSMSRAATRRDAVTRGAAGGSVRGLRDWLETVTLVSPIPMASFDTHTKQKWVPGSAAKAAAKAARERGFQPVATQSFFVEDVAGPLQEGELARAEAWAATLPALITA